MYIRAAGNPGPGDWVTAGSNCQCPTRTEPNRGQGPRPYYAVTTLIRAPTRPGRPWQLISVFGWSLPSWQVSAGSPERAREPTRRRVTSAVDSECVTRSRRPPARLPRARPQVRSSSHSSQWLPLHRASGPACSSQVPVTVAAAAAAATWLPVTLGTGTLWIIILSHEFMYELIVMIMTWYAFIGYIIHTFFHVHEFITYEFIYEMIIWIHSLHEFKYEMII